MRQEGGLTVIETLLGNTAYGNAILSCTSVRVEWEGYAGPAWYADKQ